MCGPGDSRSATPVMGWNGTADGSAGGLVKRVEFGDFRAIAPTPHLHSNLSMSQAKSFLLATALCAQADRCTAQHLSIVTATVRSPANGALECLPLLVACIRGVVIHRNQLARPSILANRPLAEPQRHLTHPHRVQRRGAVSDAPPPQGPTPAPFNSASPRLANYPSRSSVSANHPVAHAASRALSWVLRPDLIPVGPAWPHMAHPPRSVPRLHRAAVQASAVREPRWVISVACSNECLACPAPS